MLKYNGKGRVKTISMRIFVGTSGWSYTWNAGNNLRWYVEHSGLNTVELNSSFYRFPFPSYIKSWLKWGKKLRWSIKVNRLITHIYRFNKKSYSTWGKFSNLFKPMESLIDFFLFQLPPRFGPGSLEQLQFFLHTVNLGNKAAVEFRNPSWFDKRFIDWAKEIGITWVSVDSPELPREIYRTSDCVYLRMHGRTEWYNHNYTVRELKKVAEKISNGGAKNCYIYFNNNHHMLDNAQRMRETLQGLTI